MEYKIEDLILPNLTLPEPCPIRIMLDGKNVRLFVGQRDWGWDYFTGKLTGCGTEINPPVAEDNQLN